MVPLSPLTETEEKDAAELLNFAIRHRLPAENIPDSMLVTCIGMLPSSSYIDWVGRGEVQVDFLGVIIQYKYGWVGTRLSVEFCLFVFQFGFSGK